MPDEHAHEYKNGGTGMSFVTVVKKGAEQMEHVGEHPFLKRPGADADDT